MTEARETVETAAWTDRELMLRTYYQTVETNGTARNHDREIYGDPEHGLVGLKEQTATNTAYREQLKATVRVVWAIGGVSITAIFAILGILLAAYIGG